MAVITPIKLNRFWKNGILPIKKAVAGMLDKSKILNTTEEIAANTSPDYAAGALAVKELNDNLVSDIYVDDNKNLHMVKGGADTVIPFNKGAKFLGSFTNSGALDVKTLLSNYASLTDDNFLIAITKIGGFQTNIGAFSNHACYGGSLNTTGQFTKTYNASSGILTVKAYATNTVTLNGDGGTHLTAANTASIYFDVYLI